jgi:hypothetical protein
MQREAKMVPDERSKVPIVAVSAIRREILDGRQVKLVKMRGESTGQRAGQKSRPLDFGQSKI